MRGVGEGIAFAALCAAATWLEVAGHEASGLWIVVVIWAVFGDWGQKRGRDES
jgi:hypothetical protein